MITTNHEPSPPEWPYYWSPEYDIAITTSCVCDGSGWLPEPQGETMVACHVCNVAVEV